MIGTSSDATPYTGWFNQGSQILLNIDSPIVDGVERFIFNGWSGDASGFAKPFSITMDSAKNVTANYKTQFLVTFNQTGIDDTANSYIVTINGTSKGFTDLPFSLWVDKDNIVTYEYNSVVASIVSGKRFKLTHVIGPASPITVTASVNVTGNYKVQYEITFNQFGVSSDYSGTVVTVDGNNYTSSDLPFSFWWDEGSTHNFTFNSPLVVTPNEKRYVWVSTSGLSTLQSSSLTVSNSGIITGNYKIQFYFTVKSAYDSPTPTSGWFDNGTSITASVTSPCSGVTGVRYICTGWTGTGSVPASGAKTTVTFTITAPSNITWNWKTQYYLTINVEPSGITTISGEGWYNQSETVTLTAPDVSGYKFNYWDVDGTSQGTNVNPITVTMDNPHTTTAHYTMITPPSVSISPSTAKIKVGESVTFTSSTSGGEPPYQYQWCLNGTTVSGATSSSWTFTPNSKGYYIIYLNVTDSLGKTAKSNEATVTVASPLTVSISPTSASILMGQSVTFTSTVSGGYTPYSYQWYLNGNPVSGANSNSWTFTPTSSGIYYIHLKVTDANGNVEQSETARIVVTAMPVGGYSYSLANTNSKNNLTAYYLTLITLLAAVIIIVNRKRK